VSAVLRRDVVPVLSAYVVFVAMLVAYGRGGRRERPVRRRTWGGPRGRVGWGALFAYVLELAAGGYALFLLVVLTYYFALGGEDTRFVVQAFREGSILAFGIVVPAFLLLSWIHDRLTRRTERWRSSRTTDSAT
jgi:hypothetical protein